MTLISFEFIQIQESNEPLIDLSKSGFLLEPAYYNRGLSKNQRMFLRKSVADKLTEIQKELGSYKFKIWDGYRSRQVQNNIYQKFWDELKPQYPDLNDDELSKKVEVFVTKATNPKRIPPHSTGGAVDLTLIDKNGTELDMGTVFDHFGPESESLYFDRNSINETVRQNRKILKEAMLAKDFRADGDEWWHFDYGNQLWASALNKSFAVYGEVD